MMFFNRTFLSLVVFFLLVGGFILLVKSGGGYLVSKESGSGEVRSLLGEVPKLEDRGEAPEFRGLDGWLNSKPLTLEGLRGKVVLIDFWTYSCINCIRTLPHLENWYTKYKDNGFVLVGMHSPEFEFEKDIENVRSAIAEYGLTYPVAIDNAHATWRAYDNLYWPAHYLLDAEGRLRYTHFGEGKYAETEAAIQQLLLDAGLLTLDTIREVKEVPAGVDFQQIGTPEIYLGYKRLNNVGNMDEGVRPEESYTFASPEGGELLPNRFYFIGDWVIQGEYSETTGEYGELALAYKANKANMVLSAVREDSVVEVKLDGEYLTAENAGADVVLRDGKSYVEVGEARLYNLTDTGEDYSPHILEVMFFTPGVRAFTYTFG